MADEIVEQPVVDSPEGDNTPAEPKVPASTQVAVPAANSWDAEKKAFIADLQKERKARQASETQANSYKTQYETEQRRVRALSGVDPINPQEVEANEVRARFSQLYPELAGLTKEDIEAIRELKNRSSELSQTTEHYWQSHGRTMLGSLEKEVAAEFGGDKLTPSQSKVLRAAYVQAAQEDPAFLQRHEDGDETLLKEFAKTFAEDWIKPAQRKAAAVDFNQRRPIPSGKDRSVAAPGGKKIDVTDNKAVEDFLIAGYRDRGGRFRNE
jgi:FtsZ-binding cell division protein ZapB